MKKFLSLLIISIFILNSCSQPKKEFNSENEITFQQREKCNGLEKQVFEDLEKKYGSLNSSSRHFHIGDMKIENPLVYLPIYYSQTLDTCIYKKVFTDILSKEYLNKEYGGKTTIELIDYSNRELILKNSCIGKKSGKIVNGIKTKTDNDFKEYKECMNPVLEKFNELTDREGEYNKK